MYIDINIYNVIGDYSRKNPKMLNYQNIRESLIGYTFICANHTE